MYNFKKRPSKKTMVATTGETKQESRLSIAPAVAGKDAVIVGPVDVL